MNQQYRDEVPDEVLPGEREEVEEELFICDRCEGEFDKELAQEVGGGAMCPNCYELVVECNGNRDKYHGVD